MTNYLLLFLTFIVYSMYATLPFFTLKPFYHYILGCTFAICGSLLWVTISRNIDKSNISLYGLYFDAIITLSFLIVPVLLSGSNLTWKHILGICLILIGIGISKL